MCANSKDNILLVTQKGFNPVDIWPVVSTNDPTKAAADGVLLKLMSPMITTQPQSKVKFKRKIQLISFLHRHGMLDKQQNYAVVQLITIVQHWLFVGTKMAN